jgi:S1-C subfamily serine protease
MTSEHNPLTEFSESLVKAVAKAGESTLLVNGRKRIPASGIAFGADLVVTADHVVEREDDISVLLADGTSAPAVIAGRDPGNDLAVLRLENVNLTPAEKAEKEAKVGQMVIALGRPSQGGIEASLGIISAVGGPARTWRGGMLERYIRTDAIPFPGFSGGPLINAEGRVVGLNTSGLAHGAAITIPVSLVWANAKSLSLHGYIKRGYLGIRSQQVELSADMRKALDTQQETGLLLVSVEQNSPAYAGGLLVGDILVAIDGHPTRDHDDLMMHLNGETVGKSLSVNILRGGLPKQVSVKIGERKE